MRVVPLLHLLPILVRLDRALDVVIDPGRNRVLFDALNLEAILVHSRYGLLVLCEDAGHEAGNRIGAERHAHIRIEANELMHVSTGREPVYAPLTDGPLGDPFEIPERDAVRSLKMHDALKAFARVR